MRKSTWRAGILPPGTWCLFVCLFVCLFHIPIQAYKDLWYMVLCEKNTDHPALQAETIPARNVNHMHHTTKVSKTSNQKGSKSDIVLGTQRT